MIKDQHQPYDKSSKWLIQHHGDSMLRLARIEKIEAWRPAQAEVVQPRQLPDGLLEVRLQGEPQDDLFLIEVATYPERRVGKQLTGDLMLVYLDRGELPEAADARHYTAICRGAIDRERPRSPHGASKGPPSCHRSGPPFLPAAVAASALRGGDRPSSAWCS